MKWVRFGYWVLALVFVVYLSLIIIPADPYSDPEAKRAPGRRIRPLTPISKAELHEDLDFSISESPESIVFSKQKYLIQMLSTSREVIRVDNGVYREEGLSLALSGLRVSYPTSPDDLDENNSFMRRTYHGADGQPLAMGLLKGADKVIDQNWSVWGGGNCMPVVHIFLGTTGEIPIRIRGVAAYDVRTSHNIVDIATRGKVAEVAGISAYHLSLGLWHQTPIAIVVDAELGPMETRRLEIRKEQQLDLYGFSFRLKTFAPGKWVPSGEENGGLRFAPEGEQSGTTLFFSGNGLQTKHPYRLMSKDDALVASGSIEGKTGDFLVHADRNIEDLAYLEVDSYSRFIRFEFILPELPGLPEVNRDCDNLFDVRIPFVRLYRGFDIHKALFATTQLDPYVFGERTLPGGAVSMDLENVTARELLALFQKIQPSPGYPVWEQQGTLVFTQSRFTSANRNLPGRLKRYLIP